ncbi:hypothetical protein [Roseovarius sp. 2305UL8-3]|uniref:hypothetical protein n=1 Tax=Roseovarius conchicola TaxID=3121636 RepID=UPI0035287D22
MELIADILLVAGALGAGFYCYILARRLSRFNDLENGVGGAVAVLSAQVDDLTKTLEAAKNIAGASTSSLEGLTNRAEGVAKRLELLVASMHDLPDMAREPQPAPPPAPEPQAASPVPQPEAPPTGPVFKRHREVAE